MFKNFPLKTQIFETKYVQMCVFLFWETDFNIYLYTPLELYHCWLKLIVF